MSQAAQIAAAAIAAVLCCVVLRKQVPELSVILTIAAGTLLIAMVFKPLKSVFSFLMELTEQTGLPSEVFPPVIKVTGIAVITKTAGDICRDAQESGLAAFLEVCGTILALSATIPLAQSVMNALSALI